MQQSTSWEADSSSANNKIPHTSWNPHIHIRAHNNTPPVSFLTQTNTLYVPTTFCVLKSKLNIIVPSMPIYSKWLLSLRITTKILFPSLLTPNFPNAHTHLILFHITKCIITGQQYTAWTSPMRSFQHTTRTDCSWLAPTQNITICHMYMSTVVPADAQCYVTQCYHYTPEGLSWRERPSCFRILPKLYIISGQRSTHFFQNSSLYIRIFNEKERSQLHLFILLILLLLLLILILILILMLPPSLLLEIYSNELVLCNKKE